MGSVALRAPARRARQCHWSPKPRPASSVDTSRTWASPCNAYVFLTAKSRRPDPVNSARQLRNPFSIPAGDFFAIGHYSVAGLHTRRAATQILGVHGHHCFGIARVHMHFGMRGGIALISVDDLGDRAGVRPFGTA